MLNRTKTEYIGTVYKQRFLSIECRMARSTVFKKRYKQTTTKQNKRTDKQGDIRQPKKKKWNGKDKKGANETNINQWPL